MTNPHVDELSFQAAEAAFRRDHPTYGETDVLDRLRTTEYGRLDRGGHVYLDYTGGGLFASSQLESTWRCWSDEVFGNPHSVNPTSAASTRAGRACPRHGARVLQRFAGGVRGDLHAERHRSAAARRRGLSVPPGRSLPADVRQPQLGQRDSRVRASARRADDLHPERRAGSPRRRAAVHPRI